MRWSVYAIAALVLAGLFFLLKQIPPPIAGQVAEYSDLNVAAVERLDGVIDANFTLATAITGALGALTLGFNDMKLTRSAAMPVCVAVVLSVGSAVAGVVARLQLLEMLSNRADPYLGAPVIQMPLAIQQYLLLLSVAAIGWVVIDGVFSAGDK